jgi:hypothetical protein
MTDPIWDRIHELCAGYPPEFNAAAAYDVIREAWRMGFDVVKAPEGSNLYGAYCQKFALLSRNTWSADTGSFGLANAMRVAENGDGGT